MKKCSIGLKILICVFLIGIVSSCAQMQPYSSQVTNNATTNNKPVTSIAPQIIYQFPDLPIPTQLVKVDEDSTIVTTPMYQGGILVFRGRVTQDSVVNFFTKTLPQYGWHLSGEIKGKKDFLAFTKPNGSACLIQVYNTSLGFETEVQIWISEPRQ